MSQFRPGQIVKYFTDRRLTGIPAFSTPDCTASCLSPVRVNVGDRFLVLEVGSKVSQFSLNSEKTITYHLMTTDGRTCYLHENELVRA